MSQPQSVTPRDGWNVNLPALIGVVFVFLLGVVLWVVLAGGSDDDATPDTLPSPSSVATTVAPAETTDTTTPETTSPAPMPDLSATTTAPTTAATTVPATSPATTVPATVPPATTAPGSDPGTVPGDLGIPDRPMLAPPCNDSFITALGAAAGPSATAESIAAVLEQYPSSNYLRTDQTCPSLTQSIDGQPIYLVFFGPFPFASDACAARADGPPDAYARQLSETLPPDHIVPCDG